MYLDWAWNSSISVLLFLTLTSQRFGFLAVSQIVSTHWLVSDVFLKYTPIKAQYFEGQMVKNIPTSFHHILVKDVIACQCLLFSWIFCYPLLGLGLFQEGKESFPTMQLSVYLPKDLVFALFTPLDIYDQNRKINRALSENTLYQWWFVWMYDVICCLDDQWWFVWIQWICRSIGSLHVCACDYCRSNAEKRSQNTLTTCVCSLDQLLIVHQFRRNVKPNLCSCGNLSSVFVRWKLVSIVHLPLTETFSSRIYWRPATAKNYVR